MDAQTLERYDRLRFRLKIWDTVNYAVAIPTLFLIFLKPEGVLFYFWFAGIILMGISQWLAYSRLGSLEKEIRNNPELDAALDNELVRHYNNLSYKWSFYVVMTAAFILLAISPLFRVNFVPLLILIYIGMITPKILQLIMMRR